MGEKNKSAGAQICKLSIIKRNSDGLLFLYYFDIY